MPRECSLPPNTRSVFGTTAASKARRTCGIAPLASSFAQTKSLRPVTRRESSSEVDRTGAEIATTHSMSASKLDASTAWPPSDAPTSAICDAPRSRSSALAAPRSMTGDHGFGGLNSSVVPVEPSWPRRLRASAGTPRATNRGAMSRHPEASQSRPCTRMARRAAGSSPYRSAFRISSPLVSCVVTDTWEWCYKRARGSHRGGGLRAAPRGRAQCVPALGVHERPHRRVHRSGAELPPERPSRRLALEGPHARLAHALGRDAPRRAASLAAVRGPLRALGGPHHPSGVRDPRGAERGGACAASTPRPSALRVPPRRQVRAHL